MRVVGQNCYKREEMLSSWKEGNLKSIICHSETQCSVLGEIPPDFYLDLHQLDKFDSNCHQARFKPLAECWCQPRAPLQKP